MHINKKTIVLEMNCFGEIMKYTKHIRPFVALKDAYVKPFKHLKCKFSKGLMAIKLLFSRIHYSNQLFLKLMTWF